MTNAHDEFLKAFDRLLEEHGIAEAMSIATGTFVSLVVGFAKHNGHADNLPITIKGTDRNSGHRRDITIHPAKPRATAHKESK